MDKNTQSHGQTLSHLKEISDIITELESDIEDTKVTLRNYKKNTNVFNLHMRKHKLTIMKKNRRMRIRT